jgi:hypothetical protein
MARRTTGWMAGKTTTLKRQPTKKERKTKQKQQGSKENTETRRGEKERQNLSLLLDKAAQGGRESPTKEVVEKDPRFFSELLSLNKREKFRKTYHVKNILLLKVEERCPLHPFAKTPLINPKKEHKK